MIPRPTHESVIPQSGTGRRGRLSQWWWLGAAAIPVGAAIAVLVSGGDWFELAERSPFALAQINARVFMTEAALAFVTAPLAGVWSMTLARRAATAGPGLLSSATMRAGAWRVAGPVVASATLLALTSIIVALVIGTADVTTLWTSRAVLWAATLALAALGTLCAAVLRDALDAAACAVGIAIVVSVGLLVAGPVLDGAPPYVLDATLLANPLVATASSAQIDIFRIDPLYQLSPLAHTRVNYPTPGATFAWYVLAALFFFVVTALQSHRRARVFLA